MKPSQMHTIYIPPISNTSIGAFVLFYCLFYVYVLKFSFYISSQVLKVQGKESRSLVLPRTSCKITEHLTTGSFTNTHLFFCLSYFINYAVVIIMILMMIIIIIISIRNASCGDTVL
jgi:uncharacterized membrane protein SpoIIM required for sporulation